MMKKFEWKKYIYKVVVVILIVFFVGGVGMGAKNILSIEGSREIYVKDEPLTPYPQNNVEVIEYINLAINKAIEEKPMVTMSKSFDFDSDSIKNSIDNEQINASLKLVADSIDDNITDSFEERHADFNGDCSGFLFPITVITSDDIISTNIDYSYYRCSMCTSTVSAEEYSDACPTCGSEGTLEERFSDVYKITVELKGSSPSHDANQFPDLNNFDGAIAEAGSSFYSLNNYDYEETSAVIYAEINRLTDKISYLRYETGSTITSNVTFANGYKDLGTVDISFAGNDRFNYSFTWPGLKLDKNEMTVTIGSSEVLKATLSCDDATKYDVVWSSDNEDVLTVDEEGYLKTHLKHGQTGDATITAKFTFMDQVYEDKCLVHVGVPAEGVDLSKGKLKLKVGEELKLEAVFDPKDTTNTLCYWDSTDSSIATIDEYGTVKAVSKGIVTVFVITDDGNYYSSCEVEVTE